MIEIQEYIDEDGSSGFADWFNKGLWECRIHWGPGLRIYLGRDGNTLVILFGGGTKRRQSKDIEKAMADWAHYKKRKKDR